MTRSDGPHPAIKATGKRFKSWAGTVHKIHSGGPDKFTPACNKTTTIAGHYVSGGTSLTCKYCNPALGQAGKGITVTRVSPEEARRMISGDTP